MTTPARPPLLYPALVLNALIAAGTYLVAKQTLREIPPLPLTLLRFVASTLVMMAVAAVAAPGVRVERRDRPRVMLAGVLLVVGNAGLFMVGLQWTRAAHAALLYALTPAIVTLIEVLRARRAPTPLQSLGVAVAFAGVLMLLLERGLSFGADTWRGDLTILVAVCSWSWFTVLGRRLTPRYGPIRVVSDALLYGTLAYLPFGLWGLPGMHWQAITAGGWAGLAYLALLTASLNFVLWYWGVRYLPPTGVAVFSNLQPIAAAALAWMILGESLPPGFAVSTLLVLGGVWLTQREGRLPSAAAPSPPARHLPKDP